MRIPIFESIGSDGGADYRISYPRNLAAVPKDLGFSAGYLRPTPGIKEFTEGPGLDRGGINWLDECYRVMGEELIKVDNLGNVTTIGNVGPGLGLQCTLVYSFDYLGVTSAGNMFLVDKLTQVFAQIVDPDLGSVIDAVWIDGYFMSTDGEFLVVSELGDPFSILPLKYGSSELDPDPVVALKVIRNEVYAVNRYTVEVFDNIGGNNFPFQRIAGAQLQRGAVGTKACAVYNNALAFVGSGKNEEPAVYVGGGGQDGKISTDDIENELKKYTEKQLSLISVEVRRVDKYDNLYIHLPDQTLVFDQAASKKLGREVWHTEDSGLGPKSRLRAFNFTWVYNKWVCGDPTSSKIGELDETISTHYEGDITWSFGSAIIYNEDLGALVHSIELKGLPGRIPLGEDPTVFTSYTNDGETWSEDKPLRIGKIGNRLKRMQWRKQGPLDHMRTQRFFGTSQAHLSFSRLDATIEGLAF